MINKIKGVFFGLAVGDALGVPVEFKSRDYLVTTPVNGMTGFGTWNQPPGTWSDDSSLAFCLAESLTRGYDLNDISVNFIKWRSEGFWGAYHKVFDVGNTTYAAIGRLLKGISPVLAGGMDEGSNGNGSLMRIMPLVFHIKDMSIEERYTKVLEVSSITHAHFRSVLACFIYVEIAIQILNGDTIEKAYAGMQKTIHAFVKEQGFNEKEVNIFGRILSDNIGNHPVESIHSGGYVLHTLEASLWCLLNSNDYKEAVLKAVNLGGDTDTTACVAGGLAGLLYGYDAIPKEWINELARKTDIDDLSEKLYQNL